MILVDCHPKLCFGMETKYPFLVLTKTWFSFIGRSSTCLRHLPCVKKKDSYTKNIGPVMDQIHLSKAEGSKTHPAYSFKKLRFFILNIDLVVVYQTHLPKVGRLKSHLMYFLYLKHWSDSGIPDSHAKG